MSLTGEGARGGRICVNVSGGTRQANVRLSPSDSANDRFERVTRSSSRVIRSAQLGMLINAALAIVKLVAGLAGNTYALVADAVESTADIFASLVVWGGLRVASRDPNDEYPFGYGKAESVAAVVVSMMLLAAAIGIGFEAIREIRTPHQTPAPWTLLVLVGVLVIKFAIFRRTRSTVMRRPVPRCVRMRGITSLTRSHQRPHSLALRSHSGAARMGASRRLGRAFASLVIFYNGILLIRRHARPDGPHARNRHRRARPRRSVGSAVSSCD